MTSITRRLFLSLIIAVAVLNSATAELPTNQRLNIQARDLRSSEEDGLVLPKILFIYHDGSFDLFEPGHPASDALAAYAGGGNDSLLIDAAESAGFAVWRMVLEEDRFEGPVATQSQAPGMPPSDPVLAQPVLDPLATPFVSYIGRLYPGDDLFFANEDPQRHRIFDAEGRSLGPIHIDVYGQDLLDAGVRANDEQGLLLLDSNSASEPVNQAVLRDEQGVVMPHPGFVGAERQGDASPGRLLSQTNTFCPSGGIDPEACREYEPAMIDFTLPEQPLVRMRVTTESRLVNGAWTGSYYDPSRSGEGFSIDFIGEDPEQVVIFWYTYLPDGSGEQLWLIGLGSKEFRDGNYEFAIEFLSTRGGKLTSTDNPETVERIPWGTARLGITSVAVGEPIGAPATRRQSCRGLRLFEIEPYDPSIVLNLPLSSDSNLPVYELVRLGPSLSGLDAFCDGLSPGS